MAVMGPAAFRAAQGRFGHALGHLHEGIILKALNQFLVEVPRF